MEKGEDGVWGAAMSNCPPRPGVTWHGMASGPPGSESGNTPLWASGQSCPSLRKRCHFKLEEGALLLLMHLVESGWPVPQITEATPSPC